MDLSRDVAMKNLAGYVFCTEIINKQGKYESVIHGIGRAELFISNDKTYVLILNAPDAPGCCNGVTRLIQSVAILFFKLLTSFGCFTNNKATSLDLAKRSFETLHKSDPQLKIRICPSEPNIATWNTTHEVGFDSDAQGTISSTSSDDADTFLDNIRSQIKHLRANGCAFIPRVIVESNGSFARQDGY